MALLIEYRGKRPQVADDVFLAPTAVLIGDVRVEAGASIWFGAVLRGDFGSIVVGPGSNVQDNAVIHVGEAWPTIVGADVTIGHGAVLEGCTIGDGAVVGMNATVLPHASIGSEAVVGAGSVVVEGMEVPARTLAAGGIMNARAIARLYAALSDGGPDEIQLLTPEHLHEATTLQTEENDLVLDFAPRKALGYWLGNPSEAYGERAFGHPGVGGAIGLADPKYRFAFGLTKNRLTELPPEENTAHRLAQAIRAMLGIPEGEQ